MTELGTRLAQQSSKWNPRRWLEHRRDIKKFSDAGYDLYILTVVLYTAHDDPHPLLIKNAEKISNTQRTTTSSCFLRGYHPGYKYDIESTR